jgi:hypothetical protein
MKDFNRPLPIKKSRMGARGRRNSNSVILSGVETANWSLQCDNAVFERIKNEESFQQILALARAVNGLRFAISAMVPDANDMSPTARRARINSFLFGSAILYEGLLLVEKMNKRFGLNEIFSQGLHTLLKDPVARRLRKSHLGRVRNFAVFHYASEEFGKIVNSASVDECEFMVGRGNSGRESYFPFADTLAAEVLMGRASDDDAFYDDLGLVMSETRELATHFTDFSHRLILKCLHEWGFILQALP